VTRTIRGLIVSLPMCLLFLASCQPPELYIPPPQEPASIAPEMELANTAAYPEGSYVVKAGDTPRGIAARLAIDYDVLARANGFTDETVLVPGYLIVVPRVALRTPDLPGRAAARPKGAPDPGGRVETQLKVEVDPSGRLKAASGGTVTAVHRGYPALGDVVIIENDVEKIIYSGEFTPSVAKGSVVSVGDSIASGVKENSARATRFRK